MHRGVICILLLQSVRVRGAIKVKCHFMFGVVALAVDQILRVTQLRPAPA